MIIVGIIIVVGILIYVAVTISEINTRLTIIDLRHRILEALVLHPRKEEVDLYEFYENYFGGTYYRDYDKIVRFGRRHGLSLPLKTNEEIVKTESKRRKDQGE